MHSHPNPLYLVRRAIALLVIVLVAPAQAAQQHGSDSALAAMEKLAKAGISLDGATATALVDSHCSGALTGLIDDYVKQPAVREALAQVASGLKDLPDGYKVKDLPSLFSNTPTVPCEGGDGDCVRHNPWKPGAGGQPPSDQLLLTTLKYFTDWCKFLPQIDGDQDNGLLYIQGFAWFYYRNPAGQAFVQGDSVTAGKQFVENFSRQRGDFMWSSDSRTYIPQWLNDPRIEIEDYRLQKVEDYPSWNAFFAREITVDRDTRTIPSRPATMPQSQYPDRDYIVVSPTDCIMNPLVQVLREDGRTRRRYIENPLQADTVLDVKGQPISLLALLGSAPEALRQQFVGGSGMACVLMPNTYHHFHAPVNGTVVHAEVVETGTYGYSDFPNWVPLQGNVGRPGTDFSQFQRFERGVVIIEVSYSADPGNPDVAPRTGYVASIPVGLNTIGSVVLDKDIAPGVEVKRGYTRLGNFYYGGSLDILLFSKGLASGAIQTRLGNQITLFNIGKTPEEKTPRTQP